MLLDKLLQIPLYPLDFFLVLSDILNRSKKYCKCVATEGSKIYTTHTRYEFEQRKGVQK